MPIGTHVVEHVAIKHGVCIRPVPLRRIDPDTGASEIVDVPCGATTDDKCPRCAERQRSRRKAQCRQGWHAEHEPILEPDDPTDAQQNLATTRADLERAHANALANGEDTAPIESAIEEVESELSQSGVRGSVIREKPRKSRSPRRRQDVPDLPRTKVAPVTIGRTYTGNNGRTFRPSVFLTPTLPSYGPSTPTVFRGTWTPTTTAAKPGTRCTSPNSSTGSSRTCAGSPGSTCSTSPPLEPQKRLAPHLHAAIRGTISRADIRTTAAATYHQGGPRPTR